VIEMSTIRGDIKAMIGLSEITIENITIDLSKTTYQEIVEYQNIPLSIKNTDITTDEIIKIKEDYRNWITNYLIDRCKEINADDIRMFVVLYLEKLIDEFKIGFKLVSRDKLELQKEKMIKKYDDEIKINELDSKSKN
jgi:hypothetical protein